VLEIGITNERAPSQLHSQQWQFIFCFAQGVEDYHLKFFCDEEFLA